MDEMDLKDEGEQNASNIAIFWDIENVTPRRGSFFTDGLLEFAESLGKVVVQNAYADWSEKRFHHLGLELAQHHFYMVHLPYRRNQRSKNGADIQLVSDALDSLRVYEHIDTYVLVTGDSDFRPLLRPLRRMGKVIHIICDIRNASQDLLMISDSFQDYHELLPSSDDDEPDEPRLDKSRLDARDTRDEKDGKSGKDSRTGRAVKDDRRAGRDDKDTKNAKDGKKPRLGRLGRNRSGVEINEAGQEPNRQDSSYWFDQLCEAVQALESEDKTINLSTLRIKMRMLNPGFSERKLGFQRWSQFIASAVKGNYIRIESRAEEGSAGDDEDGEQVIRVVEQATHTGALTLQKAIRGLLAILEQAAESGGDKDADEEGYLLYGILNNRLREQGIEVRQLGFNQFKKFMASVETRGLIETKAENMNYSARLLGTPAGGPDEEKSAKSGRSGLLRRRRAE